MGLRSVYPERIRTVQTRIMYFSNLSPSNRQWYLFTSDYFLLARPSMTTAEQRYDVKRYWFGRSLASNPFLERPYLEIPLHRW